MPQYNVYAIGQRAIIEAYNVDSDGDPVSPTSPVILLKPPTGPEETLSVTENPTGHIYHVLSTSTRAAGKYHYRIVTADDAIERFFAIAPSAFADPDGP
jgi:hypothetical protein